MGGFLLLGNLGPGKSFMSFYPLGGISVDEQKKSY
jgi:hypothetical protein